MNKQEAIEILACWLVSSKGTEEQLGYIEGWFSREDENAFRMAIEALQPQRPKGEWIEYTEDGYVECPFCHSATTCDGNKDELHFCFSCGADMRGGS